jgi:hypothetical protein
MPNDYKFCRNGSSGLRTMADAVEALVASASFNNGDRAKVLSGPLKLPSEKIVWLALVVFDGADGTEGHVVRFRAAETFFGYRRRQTSNV